MLEKTIEQRLRKEIKKRGGVAFKFTSPGTEGVPDRLVCVPPGRMYLVETKAPGGRLRPTQKVIRHLLKMMGIEVYVICTDEELQDFKKIMDADDL